MVQNFQKNVPVEFSINAAKCFEQPYLGIFELALELEQIHHFETSRF